MLEIRNTVYKGTLRRAKVKTDGSHRTVPVPPDMRTMLQNWIEWSGASGDDLLFPGKDGKSPMWPGVWLQKRVQSVAKKLGITTTVTFQVLRRSFATDTATTSRTRLPCSVTVTTRQLLPTSTRSRSRIACVPWWKRMSAT